MTIDDIIREEIEGILKDLRKAYQKSGRKVTGQFEKGLHVEYKPLEATISGYVYLAGRGKTRKKGKPGEPTLLEVIKKWIDDKGLRQQFISKSKAKTEKQKFDLINGIAYAITKKIHEEGTNRASWFRIYETVITPDRILQIIDRISLLNVNKLISEINVSLEILAKNV